MLPIKWFVVTALSWCATWRRISTKLLCGPIALSPLLLIGMAMSHQASAASIDCALIPLGGQEWRCDYVVQNDGTYPIEQFTIFFDYTAYSGVSLTGSPVTWDSIVVVPDVQLPADGFFDSVALEVSLAPGESLSGFSVAFTFTGAGVPGGQAFDIVDPVTFSSLYRGVTEVIQPHSVPEPGTMSLLLFTVLLPAAARVRSAGMFLRSSAE